MSFKQLQKIDKRTKFSVYGWIRNKEKELRLRNVPSMITAICILYFREEEIFDFISDNGIKVSENKKIITKFDKDNQDSNNNYGITKIESENECVYQWDLNLIKISNCSAIGIAAKVIENGNIQSYEEDCLYYFFYQNSIRIYAHSSSTGYDESDSHDITEDTGWREGDKVSINLNLKKGEIKLLINDKIDIRTFQNVKKSKDIKYRLFVSLHSIGDSVEIINFSRK